MAKLTAQQLKSLPTATRETYIGKPWTQPLIEKVIEARGEIVRFDQIPGASGRYRAAYRPAGTKQFITTEVSKFSVGQAASQIVANINRAASLRVG